MRYPTISIAEGRRALDALRHGVAYTPEAVWVGEGSKDFDLDLVDDVVMELQSLRKDLGEPVRGDPRYFSRFEGLAARAVHETLELPPAVAVDHEFWIWFVLGGQHDYLAKLVTWRHGVGEEAFGALDVNYGLTTNLEAGLYSRMWLRADLVYDDSRNDPYELAERGDQDLWRSHILRTEYGQVPNVARALLLFQYPDSSPYTPTVKTKVMREMAKELRRRQAASAYELLDFTEAQDLVQEVHDTVVGR